MIKRPFTDEDQLELVDSSLMEGELLQEEEPDEQLRPQLLKEYIGQDEIKRHATLLIDSAKLRGEPLDHILIHGAPGLGKTTLAQIFAKEMYTCLRFTSGPALEKPGDLASILSSLQPGEILFIDEIHRLRAPVEEILYSAMEDFVLDLVVGKGPTAKSLRIKLPKFTLLGATTKLNQLSAPLRDRFGSHLKLDYYLEHELHEILVRSAVILGLDADRDAMKLLACCSRRTPRIANRLLKRVRDFTVVTGGKKVLVPDVEQTLAILGVDSLGATKLDQEFLFTIRDKFNSGPVGLGTIAAAMQEDAETLAEITEPFLMQLGFLQRTHRGRIISDAAKSYLQSLAL